MMDAEEEKEWQALKAKKERIFFEAKRLGSYYYNKYHDTFMLWCITCRNADDFRHRYDFDPTDVDAIEEAFDEGRFALCGGIFWCAFDSAFADMILEMEG